MFIEWKQVIWRSVALFVLVGMVSACGVTKVKKEHGLLQSDLSRPHATVYFMRANTEHPQGFADNSLAVEIDGELLISLAKGEYTMAYLKPRQITVTLKNLAQAGGRWEVKEMERSRQFRLQPDETYFINANAVDGEFRGVRFIPEMVSQFEAKKISEYLRAVGKAARKARIADL